MKKIFDITAILIIAATFITSAYAKQQKENMTPKDPKILIAYYSWSGNTKEIAEAIQAKTDGTLYRIETMQSYPTETSALLEQAKKEINDGYLPKLKDKIDNINQYDIIFIGSPNWWGTITPAVSSFLSAYNLKGKTIIPFITYGSGGVQNTIKDLTAQCAGCNVSTNGWAGQGNNILGLNDWIDNLDLKNNPNI